MIEIDDKLVSFDIIAEHFLCDIEKCKGICCEEGDSGAPLSNDEMKTIETVLPKIWDEISPEIQTIIKRDGYAYKDEEGEMVTQLVNKKECVFAYKEQGIWKCIFQKAYEEGKITFEKPSSCHLYPIRLQKYKDFTALSYHKWKVCDCACELGKKEKLPIYKFLKGPLITKFGEAWYAELEKAAVDYNKAMNNE